MAPTYDYDAEGLRPLDYGPIPKGDYRFIIAAVKEGVSGAMNTTFKITLLVDEKDFVGKEVPHSVTILPKDHKAAGMLIHFLKVIGEPYEGKLKINTDAWLGKRFVASVHIEEYPVGSGKFNNKLSGLRPVTDGVLVNEEVRKRAQNLIPRDESGEEVPF